MYDDDEKNGIAVEEASENKVEIWALEFEWIFSGKFGQNFIS